MGVHYISEVPSEEEIKALYPMSPELEKIKEERDAEIARVIRGESDRFLAIIGPCSADNEEAVLDYTTRLAGVQEKVKDYAGVWLEPEVKMLGFS